LHSQPCFSGTFSRTRQSFAGDKKGNTNEKEKPLKNPDSANASEKKKKPEKPAEGKEKAGNSAANALGMKKTKKKNSIYFFARMSFLFGLNAVYPHFLQCFALRLLRPLHFLHMNILDIKASASANFPNQITDKRIVQVFYLILNV